MEKVLKQLQRLGFGEYEARAYAALIPRQPLNGYELAKVSGVPRANIYAVLQKLEARGAVARVETSSGARYAPVPPTELMKRLSDRFAETFQETQQSLEKRLPARPSTNTFGTPAAIRCCWRKRA